MRPVHWRTRAYGLALGVALDAVLGDPKRGHPVALFGRAASRCERALWQPSRGRGVLYTGALVGGTALAGAALERAAGRSRLATGLLTAAGTWAVLGGTSLAREGRAMERHLVNGRVPAARERLSHLCSRDPALLGEAELARATVESLAENTSDAVVAPLFWGAVAGLPGLLGYRAANTLDAMVGYRSLRYREFGWASARLDDALNYIPARLTAATTLAVAPLVGGSPAEALRAWREDAPAHPSPNAGPVEATTAAVLGVELGGASVYSGAVEDRGTLGRGRPVRTGDIGRAVRLTRAVGLAAAAVLVAGCLARGGRRTR